MENNNKLLNNILLIVILLLVANYLSNGTLIDILKKYYYMALEYLNQSVEGLKNTEFKGKIITGIQPGTKMTPEIVDDQDFKMIYQKKDLTKDDPSMKKLYHFLQSLITPSKNQYEIVASKNKAMTMSQNDKDSLNKFIIKSFNCGDFKFTNLVILDSIIYFENPNGKEVRPFRISGDAYINNSPVGKITLHLEMFIRLDSTFYGPFNSGFPTFTRIKLIRKDKIATPISESQLNKDIDEMIQTENSLIPDSINFSTDDNSMNDSYSE